MAAVATWPLWLRHDQRSCRNLVRRILPRCIHPKGLRCHHGVGTCVRDTNIKQRKLNGKHRAWRDIPRTARIGYGFVEANSALAGRVRWRARDLGKPLAALQVGGRPPTAFIPEQVLVDAADADLVNVLVERYGAEVVPSLPLPPPPEGLGPQEGVSAENMPIPVRLRVANPPPASTRAARCSVRTIHRPWRSPLSGRRDCSGSSLNSPPRTAHRARRRRSCQHAAPAHRLRQPPDEPLSGARLLGASARGCRLAAR